ncbi:hypothetical protein ACSVH2_06835 [Flavobacterium sp. RSB2_4_14]|uniref:hypothetical protein n=1 Tax=Flavobacterium sp. RSB2_4_14 TaxID=3447665 RepID=UPI003F35D061
MKKIYLVFLLIFSLIGFSQTTEKSIILIDAASNLPIESATVYILKTKQTLLSNAEGKITFELNGTSNIQVTHSSYLSVTVRSSALQKTDYIIYLKSNINDLDEIIVTKQHPQKILKSIVENSIKKLTSPARLKVYSREFFKQDGAHAYYNDGLLNFQLTGKNNKFKSTILVEQNRSFGLVNDAIGAEVLGYNLNDIMQNYYNFKYLLPILETKAIKQYDYVIKGYTANADYNVMLVTPIDKTKELRDDFKIIYDNKKKVIVEVSSTISPSTLANTREKKMVGSKNIYKSIFKTIYRIDDVNYYLVSSQEEIGFERIDRDKKTDIEVRNYFVTTFFSTQNFEYKESEVFKDKTLYNKKNVILTNYWDISGLTSTEEEEKIIEVMAAKSY